MEKGVVDMIFYLTAVWVVLLDQWSKWIVSTRMEVGETIPFIPGWFYFTSHRNPGAAFGILANQRWFFIVTTVIVIIGIVWYLTKIRYDRSRRLIAYALSFVLGGAIGNFIDRVAYGKVVDFFDFHHGTFYFAIFNVADVAIVLGVGLIFLDTILDWRNTRTKRIKEA
jgi:signal peptidase II